jgi:hypothetical protein
MIAGILDAMWSDYPFAVRTVWQCIENRADRARIWTATDAEIADEIHASGDTVSRAIAILEADKIIGVVRHKRRRTTFRMLRSYPDGCPRRPDLSPQNPWSTPASFPELTPEFAEPTAELSPEKPETKSPPDKNPPGKGSESARPISPDLILSGGQIVARSPERPADRPSPQPVEPRPAEPQPTDADPPRPVRLLDNGRVDVGQGNTRPPPAGPLPDGWPCRGEDLAFARSLGLDPQETTLAFADHYHGNGEWRADWSAVFRSWCRRERKFYPTQAPRTRAERDAAGFYAVQAMAVDLMAQGIPGVPRAESIVRRAA